MKRNCEWCGKEAEAGKAFQRVFCNWKCLKAYTKDLINDLLDSDSVKIIPDPESK